MATYKYEMNTIYLFLLCFLFSCASASSKFENGDQARPKSQKDFDLLDSCRKELPVATYPRGRDEWSRKLYSLLIGIGVKEKKIGREHILSAYDLTCEGMGLDSARCTFSLSSERNGKKVKSKDHSAASDLAEILFQFPVDQGDGGNFIRYVECVKTNYSTDCYLTIRVNYEGP